MKLISKLSDPKKIYRLFLRIYGAINSPICQILNLFQSLKRVENRVYKTMDPVDRSMLLYAPTYDQLKAMRRELLLRKKYYSGIGEIANANGGNTIIDVGANIGYYSRACSHYCKDLEIIGIEPSLKNLSFCSMNLSDLFNVTLIQCGFGDSFGRFDVSIPDYARSRKGEKKFNTGLFSAIGNESSKGTRFFKFDSFCHHMEINFKDIAWIKIDVEGFELNVLNGMKELLHQTSAAIELELNSRTLNLSNTKFIDMLSIFKEFNYVPLHNKDIEIDYEISKVMVYDLVFIKKEYIDVAKKSLGLTEFSEDAISKWNEVYEKKFG